MSDFHHGTKRQAPAWSPNPSNTNEDLSGEDDSSIPGTATYVLYDGSYTRKAPARRRRKPFEAKRKLEVAEVRKIGACKICKSRKVRCTHVLPKIKTESSNEPKTADEQSLCSFDSSSIVKTGDWTKPEESKLGPLNTDVHDPLNADFGWVPTPTTRRDRIALNVHDIENAINAPNPPEYSGPQGILNSQSWAEDQSWIVHPISQNFLESPATPMDSNATYISHASPRALTSESLYGESELAFPRAVVHLCNVYGCDFAAHGHGFANELELRRHQESIHPDLYPPEVTYACPAPGCDARRFMLEQNRNIHIATTHSELLEQGDSFAQWQGFNVSSRFGNLDQADSFLIGDEHNPLMRGNLDSFANNSRVLGDQIAPRNTSRPQTISSRGANSPRGRPRALEGVSRRNSLRKSHSRSRSQNQTASENGKTYLRAHDMGHSKVVTDIEATSMGSIPNIPFQMPVASAGRRIDGINETELDIWMPQNSEQNAMLPMCGPTFTQSFEMGTSLHAFQRPNVFQEEPSRHRRQSHSFMRNSYPFQSSMPSNVGWNQEIDQSPYSLGSTFGNPYRNLRSHLASEDIQSNQGDFSIQPFASSDHFISRPPFRTSRNDTYSGLNPNLDIPAAPSQYLSNEDCSTNFHSRSTSIQTPIITISQAPDDADSSLDFLRMRTDMKSVQLQPRMASLPQSYFSTSLSSSGANESLQTQVEPAEMKNLFLFSSIHDVSGGIGNEKNFMNVDYDNVSNISGFAGLNMLDDMQP